MIFNVSRPRGGQPGKDRARKKQRRLSEEMSVCFSEAAMCFLPPVESLNHWHGPLALAHPGFQTG